MLPPDRGWDMVEYRAYPIGRDGHIVHRVDMLCDDDEAAKAHPTPHCHPHRRAMAGHVKSRPSPSRIRDASAGSLFPFTTSALGTFRRQLVPDQSPSRSKADGFGWRVFAKRAIHLPMLEGTQEEGPPAGGTSGPSLGRKRPMRAAIAGLRGQGVSPPHARI